MASTPRPACPMRRENPQLLDCASARRVRAFLSRVCKILDSIRMASAGNVPIWKPCGRCGETAHGWDRINGKAYCPACEESILQGDDEPLVESTRRRKCTVCHCVGTVALHTFPLQSNQALEMDLCPSH